MHIYLHQQRFRTEQYKYLCRPAEFFKCSPQHTRNQHKLKSSKGAHGAVVVEVGLHDSHIVGLDHSLSAQRLRTLVVPAVTKQPHKIKRQDTGQGSRTFLYLSRSKSKKRAAR